MKTDIRKYIPPTQEQLSRFERALSGAPGKASDEGFSRLMGGVKAARRLARFRAGQDSPTSLRVLVDTICTAHGIGETDVLRVVSVGKGLWHKALSGRVEPYRVAADRYALLGRRFGVHFAALRQAVLGSYSLFMQQHLDTSVRFARSSRQVRRSRACPEQMAAAFGELRTKSAAHRQALAGNGAVDRFLRELHECRG